MSYYILSLLIMNCGCRCRLRLTTLCSVQPPINYSKLSEYFWISQTQSSTLCSSNSSKSSSFPFFYVVALYGGLALRWQPAPKNSIVWITSEQRWSVSVLRGIMACDYMSDNKMAISLPGPHRTSTRWTNREMVEYYFIVSSGSVSPVGSCQRDNIVWFGFDMRVLSYAGVIVWANV
jgi:hypothetical protein